MSHRWAALVLVLALCAATPKIAAGQSPPPRGHKAGGLGQNFPNPFNPETFIPFEVGDPADGCVNDGGQHTVTLKVLNALGQLVATPRFQGPAPTSTAAVSAALNGKFLSELSLPCGRYIAWWDGFYQGTTREAASGIYVYQFFVDRKLVGSKRMYNKK